MKPLALNLNKPWKWCNA